MKLIRESRATGVRLLQLDDGRYRVSAGDEVFAETRSEGYAVVVFEETVVERDTARSIRAAERSHYDMQATRSEAFERRATNARKKGGRGGRGGV